MFLRPPRALSSHDGPGHCRRHGHPHPQQLGCGDSTDGHTDAGQRGHQGRA